MFLRGAISVVCRAPFEINRNRIMPHSCTAYFQQSHMGFSQKHKALKDLFTFKKSLYVFIYRRTVLCVAGVLTFPTEKYTKVNRAVTSLTVLPRHLQWIIKELGHSLNLGRHGFISLLSLQ